MADSSAVRLRLLQIADELEAIPIAIDDMPGPMACAGAPLILEAIDLGAFRGAEHAALRVLVIPKQPRHTEVRKQPRRTEEDWLFSVFSGAVRCLAPDLFRQHGSVGAVEPACAVIAEAIRREAEGAKDGQSQASPSAIQPVHDGHREGASNGPVEPDAFAWDGVTYHGLARKPYLALTLLWNRPNRTAESRDLAEPVWGDREADIPDNGLAGLRRGLNSFFREKKIPIHAKLINGFISLADGDPRPAKTKRRRG